MTQQSLRQGSVCVLLLHEWPEVPTVQKLRLTNRMVAEHMEGRRSINPPV